VCRRSLLALEYALSCTLLPNLAQCAVADAAVAATIPITPSVLVVVCVTVSAVCLLGVLSLEADASEDVFLTGHRF